MKFENPSKKELFDTFAYNLTLYVDKFPGHFLCPLCHGAFPEALVKNHLSRAHIVPKALGGTHYTLLCTCCNSTLGSSVESELVKQVKLMDPTLPQRVNLLAGSSSANARATVDLSDDIPSIKFELKIGDTNPMGAEEVFTALRSGKKLQVEFQVANDQKAELAWLGSAFLLCFHHLGYEFALSPLGLAVRALILEGGSPSGLVRTVERLELEHPSLLRYEAECGRCGLAAYLPCSKLPAAEAILVLLPDLLLEEGEDIPDSLSGVTFIEINFHHSLSQPGAQSAYCRRYLGRSLVFEEPRQDGLPMSGG